MLPPLARNCAAAASLSTPSTDEERHGPMTVEIYNPETLGAPLGQYHHVARVRRGSLLYIAGMLAADRDGNVAGVGDFDAQAEQVYANVHAALQSAGAGWGNVVSFTTYLVHSQSIPAFMRYRLRRFPDFFPDGKYPPNTLLIVDRLVKEEFLFVVQTVAAVDD
jgi:enamine deaminase RidA (YjgF/YER057c/UK114 family)